MRIDGLYLRGVGPFQEVKLDFLPRKADDKADVHIFVGPNGSGKSTLLYALAGALGGPTSEMGGGQVFRRMPLQESTFAVSAGGGVVAFARGAHKLEPNRLTSPEDQERARVTIAIFGLNVAPRCESRRRHHERHYMDAVLFSRDELDVLPYRYLAPPAP